MRDLPIGVAFLGLIVAWAGVGQAVDLQNIALGRSYALSPAANYPHCTDPDDAVQLTDGRRTTGRLWTNEGAVGWTGSGTKSITIDLGKPQPIAGFAFSTAAGVAGVDWPADLWVYVSDDDETWHFTGGLLEMSAENAFPTGLVYANHTFRTTSVQTHGRYVRIDAVPAKHYFLFVDEIEVYRGDDAWLDDPRPAAVQPDDPEPLATQQFNSVLKLQLRRDLSAIRQDVAGKSLTALQRQDFTRQLDAMSRQIAVMPTTPREGFRAVLPMTDLERNIFRLQARVWRAQGKAELRVWKSHRWDPLPPSAEPTDGHELALEVDMMRGETRADVLNMTNAGEADRTMRVRVTDLPGGSNPDYLRVHEVLCVGARRSAAVSAALPPANKEADDYLLVVPPGMTRQLWFSFRSGTVDPGTHAGNVVVTDSTGTELNVPLRLRVRDLRFPERTTLRFGCWDYTDGDGIRGVTPENRLALIAYLREHLVNTPWATSTAMPFGRYDEQGNLVEEPDTARFDEWVSRWPGAECYMVFNALGHRSHTKASFAGSTGGTELFDRKVASWIRFWAQHMRDLGLSPKQLGLLVFDEPSTTQHYDVISTYARAINRAEPDVILWLDPQPRDDQTGLEMMGEMDVLVPYRKQWLIAKAWFPELFADQKRRGRELGFYSCDGPARRFDPFSYYLLQQWHCFAIGATWTTFWSVGDIGKAEVWNEYDTAGGGPFTPVYLDSTSVIGAKYMEAIREGVQDYEYLVLLRDVLARADRPDNDPAVARAQALLNTACDRVLAGETRDNYRWDEEKDRGVADRVRVEILEALSALGKQ